MSLLYMLLVASTVTTVSSNICTGNQCRKWDTTRNYTDPSRGLYSTPLETAKGFLISKGYAKITWPAYTFDQEKWEGYILWFGWVGKPKPKPVCRFVPKNQTFLFIENPKMNWNQGSNIWLHVDTYPMPINHGNYNRKWISLDQGPENHKDDECLPTTISPAISSSSPEEVLNISSTSETTPTSSSSSSETTPTSSSSSSASTYSAHVKHLSTKKDNSVLWKVIAGCIATLLMVVLVLLFYYFLFKTKSKRHGIPSASYANLQTEARSELFYTVSYFPENEEYVDKVASIVNWFRENVGYPMTMDKMATTEICSKGPARWAESQFQKADKVLVFLSPGYNAMYAYDDDEMSYNSTDDEKRVWYEMQLLKNMYYSTRSASKIVCLSIDDKMADQTLPPWAAVTHCWPKDRDKIIMRLNDVSEIAACKVALSVNQ